MIENEKRISLTLEEQEVIIGYDRACEKATFYTSDPVEIRRIKKMMQEYPKDIRLIKEDEVSIFCEVPKVCVIIRKPKAKRVLSDEERQRRSDHMKSVRNRKES